jgi:hypothetical protein
MKALLSVLTLSLALRGAMAQITPPNRPSQETTQPTTPQTNTQKDAKSGTPSASPGTTPAEMKTTTYKGALVDLSCAHTSASGEATPAAGGATKTSDKSQTPASDQSNTANRSTNDSGASCPVSASSTELGMKLDDGKTVRFDLVGTQRAQDALKNDKRWSKDISANKPIHVTVSGVLNGDKLIVSSIH